MTRKINAVFDHCDVLRRRYIHERPRSLRLELKGLRVTGEPDFPSRVSAVRVHQAQRAFPIADDNLARSGVVAEVVGIVELLDPLYDR